MVHLLVHGKDDNVAVAVVNVKKGESLSVLNMITEETYTLESLMDVPLGHKVALRDFSKDDTVIKYDSDIGRVVAPIKKGEHVHIHNLKTKKW